MIACTPQHILLFVDHIALNFVVFFAFNHNQYAYFDYLYESQCFCLLSKTKRDMKIEIMKNKKETKKNRSQRVI